LSGGAIAALVAAGAFALLVLLLAIPLLKLGRVLDEATLAIRKTHEGAAPLLDEAQGTMSQVNAQLLHVEGITKNVNAISSNAAAMSAVVSSTLGGPMIKAAAFTYGVRRTVQARREQDALKEARRARARRGRH
jgi:uncharacterized protein YoxC